MIFESLYIKSFGKLLGYTVNFNDGVNIIEGANESGKSTIAAFIKFMFFGMPSKTEEKLHLISWHTGSAGGSLTFREGEKRYRIEREVTCSTNAEGKNSFRERLAVFDADSSLAVFKGQSPGEVFFGVSAHVFESTAYIRQLIDTKVGSGALGEEAENILFSGNESINTKKALDKLDGARAFLLHKNRKGGRIAELEAERDRLSSQLEEAKKASGDIIYLEGTHRQLTEKKEESERRLAAVNRELDTFNHYTVKKACIRSKAEKSRLAETEAKIEALRSDPAHGGHDIASTEFIQALEEKQQKLNLCASHSADAEAALKAAEEKLEDISEKLEIYERLGKSEKRDRYIHDAQTLHNGINAKKFGVLLFVMAGILFGLIAAVFHFVAKTLPPVLTYIALALVPVCLIIAVLFLLQKKKLQKALLRICGNFGCKDLAALVELVRAAKNDEGTILLRESARDEAKDRFSDAADAFDAANADIINTLKECGFTIHETTAISMKEALTLCRETRTEITKLNAVAAEQRSRIDALADDLSAYEEEYIREALFTEYDEAAMESFNLASKKRDRDFLNGSISSLSEKLHGIELELATLEAGNYKPTELAEKKAVLDEEIEALTRKWAAYVLAIESIENASGKLREGISPKIAKNASRLMNAITDGKYDTLGVDLDFALSFSAEGMTRDASYLSAGTGDLAYICLRIALIELLYKKSMPPFIFDESFVRMDDARLMKMMTLLSKYAERGCQSILFSCHSREKECMEKLGSYTHLSI